MVEGTWTTVQTRGGKLYTKAHNDTRFELALIGSDPETAVMGVVWKTTETLRDGGERVWENVIPLTAVERLARMVKETPAS